MVVVHLKWQFLIYKLLSVMYPIIALLLLIRTLYSGLNIILDLLRISPLFFLSCVVREKAKNLVAILKDENRLKEERERALQARHRQGGIGSDGSSSGTPKGTPKSNKK